jgi:PAS domain S-box-containing protein
LRESDFSPSSSARARHARGVWVVVLASALACATLLFVLLFKLPGGAAIERSAELAATLADLAQLAAVPADAVGQGRRHALIGQVDQRLDSLRDALSHDRLEPARLGELEAGWRAARADAHGTTPADVQGGTVAQLLPIAQALTGEIRAAHDALQRRLETWVKALTAAMAVLLLVPLFGLWRQRRQVRLSLSQFSDDLGSGDWQDAVHALRHERRGPPSAFGALASGVESVLGESDRRWQALAELSADWYWESDVEHRISRVFGSMSVFVSQGWQLDDLIGWRHDQIAFFRSAGSDGWATFQALLDRREQVRDFEFSIVSRDRRSMRWVTISARPRTDGMGAFIGYEGVGRDVTERKRALARLQSSEQRWATMVRLASDWYWETDEQHRVLPMTPEHHRRVAWFADKAEGRTLWAAFPAAMDAQTWDQHRADVESNQPFHSLLMCLDGDDGARRWLTLSGVPRLDAQGRLRGYHGVGRDVSAHKEAERVLLRHNEALKRAVAERTAELEAVNRDLEAFARQLAHELRTPIGHVQGLAHLLQARAAASLGDEDRQLLDLQVQAAGAMRDTVDALLNLARSTMQPMPTEPVDLSALAHEVVASLPTMHRTAPVQWDIPEGVVVQAAPEPLRIVLANLLGNAAKFTRRTAKPLVRISARHDAAGRVHVSVADNGVGFDPQQAGRLFTPFGRLHAGEDYHGTGIGLTIVQRIVERHGGSVLAAVQPEGGARFEFTLLATEQTPATPLPAPRAGLPLSA